MKKIFRKTTVNLIGRVMIMSKITEHLQPCLYFPQIGSHKQTGQADDPHHLWVFYVVL